MGSRKDGNPVIDRRTKVIVLVVGLAVVAVVTAAVLPTVALTRTIMKSFEHNRCDFGFRNLIIGCTFQASRTVTSTPLNPPGLDQPRASFESGFIDETSWEVTNRCPLGPTAKRLL